MIWHGFQHHGLYMTKTSPQIKSSSWRIRQNKGVHMTGRNLQKTKRKVAVNLGLQLDLDI
jgi:hypothetical protein